MKHTLLTRLDSIISSIASELNQVQALTLAGLSISRLWTPFEKWALEDKALKLIEWGTVCFNTLWDQINLEQLYGQDFDKYYQYLDKIDGKIERLADKEIEVEGSIAYPLLEVFDAALCCFYDPKLLPGLQRSSFIMSLCVIVILRVRAKMFRENRLEQSLQLDKEAVPMIILSIPKKRP